MGNSCKLTIFEGPDGSGKTTAIKRWLELNPETEAVHHGPYLGETGPDLVQRYARSIMPAVLGWHDVVLDRCWYSEAIYGPEVRGVDRLGVWGRRALDRLALRCATQLVLCLPAKATCLKIHAGRAGDEYVKRQDQLDRIYAGYERLQPSLFAYMYNFERSDAADVLQAISSDGLGSPCHRTSPHPTAVMSAGNLDAKVLLVGEAFTSADTSEFRWPFSAPKGCSVWLAEQLERRGIGEHKLLWVNTDQPELPMFIELLGDNIKVVALGSRAGWRLRNISFNNSDVIRFEHPKHHKRFKFRQPYPLIEWLERVLS